MTDLNFFSVVVIVLALCAPPAFFSFLVSHFFWLNWQPTLLIWASLQLAWLSLASIAILGEQSRQMEISLGFVALALMVWFSAVSRKRSQSTSC